MLSNYSKICDFHRDFGRTPDPEVPTVTSPESRLLRAKLIWEEMNELFEELGVAIESFESNPLSVVLKQDQKQINLAKVAKETADLLYVTYGTAASMGLPIDEVYGAVHESNMSKKTVDGKVLRREDGKVLKSDQYKEPNIEEILKGEYSNGS